MARTRKASQDMAPPSVETNTQVKESNNAPKKNVRGPTMGIKIQQKRKKSKNGKLDVIIPENLKVAVGAGASDFVTETSCAVRQHARHDVTKWKLVPDIVKDRIVLQVLDTFNLECTPHIRATILEEANRLYRLRRSRLHDYYLQFESKDECLKNQPTEVDASEWKFLVDYFSNPEFQKVSERNKSNRSRQVINHVCGRKSFQAISHDARDPDTGKEPNYQKLWELTHIRKNGEWIDKSSEELNDKVTESVNEQVWQLQEEERERVDKDQIVNASFVTIIGERSGYCRGRGSGVSASTSKHVLGIQEQLRAEQEKRERMEAQFLSEMQEERRKREEMEARLMEGQREMQATIQALVSQIQMTSAGLPLGVLNMISSLCSNANGSQGSQANVNTDNSS